MADAESRTQSVERRGFRRIKGGMAPDQDSEGRGGHVASVAVLIGASAAVVAGATIWLLLTDPVTVANAVDAGEISPLVLSLAEIIYNALASLLDYL